VDGRGTPFPRGLSPRGYYVMFAMRNGSKALIHGFEPSHSSHGVDKPQGRTAWRFHNRFENEIYQCTPPRMKIPEDTPLACSMSFQVSIGFQIGGPLDGGTQVDQK
jgi:hypothetical protein